MERERERETDGWMVDRREGLGDEESIGNEWILQCVRVEAGAASPKKSGKGF